MSYKNSITSGNSYNPLVKIDIGIIQAVTFISNEHVYYTVFLENYHQENQSAEGIPVFSFGYNTYTYIKKSRVVCLIKDSDYTKVFILGQTYDPNIIRGIGAAKPGELNISSDKNGIIGIGTGDGVQINAGDSKVSISSDAAKISVGKDTNINLNPTQFGISLNNNENFSIKNGQSVLNASKGFKVFSEQGGIYLSSDAFSFTERTGAGPSYLITNSIHRLVGDEFLSLFSVYNFEVGSSKIKGKTNAVEWNVLQGSYSFKLTTGDFKIDMLNALGAEFSLKIGPSDFIFSKLIFNKSSLNIEIDSTLIGKSTFMLGSNELKINLKSQFPLIVSETNIEIFTSKIYFKNKDIFGLKTASFEISDGDLILIPASKALGGKIKLDGEVEITGSLIVRGSDGVSATVGDVTTGTISKISLKNHKHATSVPGSPSPPLPG
jgi:hypothetical protein